MWNNPFAGPGSWAVFIVTMVIIYVAGFLLAKSQGHHKTKPLAVQALILTVILALSIGALGVWNAQWEDDSNAASVSSVAVMPVAYSTTKKPEPVSKCADSCPTVKERRQGFGEGKRFDSAKGVKAGAGVVKKINVAMSNKGYKTGGDRWWKGVLDAGTCLSGVVQASMCFAGKGMKPEHVRKVIVRCGGEAVIITLTAAGVGAVSGGAAGAGVGSAIGFGGGYGHCMYNRWMDHNNW